MDKAVAAADANRRFPELLRTVKNGGSVIVTSHGKPVAKIMSCSTCSSEKPKGDRRARAAVLSWRDAYPALETSAAVMVNATDLASDRGLTIWDSVVLTASAQAGWRLLLSEDLQEGFTWRGVTVTSRVCGRSTHCWRHCSPQSGSPSRGAGPSVSAAGRAMVSSSASTIRKRRTGRASPPRSSALRLNPAFDTRGRRAPHSRRYP